MLATFVALLCLMPVAQAKTIVNVTGKTATVIQSSTLYVGEVVLNGQQSFYYLYSEDLTNFQTVFDGVKDGLLDFKGGMFSTLVPYIDCETEDKGIAVCSSADYTAMMNSDWTSAANAGLACLPNTAVSSSSSNDLYETDADFAARCSKYFDLDGVECVDNAGNPWTFSGILGNVAATGTFGKATGMENWTVGPDADDNVSGIPEGWTVVNDANPTLSLADNADNSNIISDAAASGQVYDVTLAGRTFSKDGKWNTLCLPFDVSDFAGTPLEGAAVRTLSSSDFNDGTLTLNFGGNLTAVEAGKPYIVKWDEGDDITDPTFEGVIVSAAEPTDVETTYASFHGIYSPHNTGGEDKTMLFMGADNTVYYPNADMTIGACRAYFPLNGITAGDLPTQARAFVLNFDGGSTGISLTPDPSPRKGSSGWYSLDGRKLSGKPTRRGIYVNNGRKVVMK